MFPGNSYGHLHVTPEGSLKVQGAQKEDSGFLVCSALSVAGSVTARASLDVTSVADLPPPLLDFGPTNQTVAEGTMVALPCQAHTPAAAIRWIKDGAQLDTARRERLEMKPTGTLLISGTYNLLQLRVAAHL